MEPEVRITGEAVSEFSIRLQNLTCVKARVEIKATDKHGKVLAIDRQTEVVVDLNEILGGKKALQLATEKLAARMIPVLAQ